MEKISLKSFIHHSVFLLVIIAIYFLNNDRNNATNTIILNNILSVFTFIILAFIAIEFINNLVLFDKVEFIYIFFLIVSVFLTLFFRMYLTVHFVYLLASFIIIKTKTQLNNLFLQVILYLTTLSILLQLAFLRFDGRPVLSFFDPNYSGFFIFIFFLFLFRKRNVALSILIGSLGFLTLSRNYLLAMLVFIITSLPLIIRIVRKIKIINFYSLFILGVLIPLLVGFYFLKNIAGNYNDVNDGKYNTSSSRLFEFKDRSNEDRFMANALFLSDIITTPKKYLWGRDIKDYTKYVFPTTPHNSFFQLVLNYGIIFSLFYILLFGKLVNITLQNAENIPYILSIMVYFIFLGGGIYGVQVMFFFFLLNENIVRRNAT